VEPPPKPAALFLATAILYSAASSGSESGMTAG
jgi:hypothetical protein